MYCMATINILLNFKKEKPISVAILNENFASHSILSLNLPFIGLFYTYAFVLVVSDVMCVFSGETDF